MKINVKKKKINTNTIALKSRYKIEEKSWKTSKRIKNKKGRKLKIFFGRNIFLNLKKRIIKLTNP